MSAVLNEAGAAVKESNVGVGEIAVSVGEQGAASNEITRNIKRSPRWPREPCRHRTNGA